MIGSDNNNNFLSTLQNAGQNIMDASGGDYNSFQQQLVAASAALRQNQMQMQLQDTSYQNDRAQERSQTANTNYSLQRQYLQTDYNTYAGYMKTVQQYQSHMASVDINNYLANAANVRNNAMYNMSSGILQAAANAGSAKTYFSGSQMDVNTGSAKDIQINMINKGYQAASASYAQGLNQSNAYIADASKTANNLGIEQMTQNEQLAMMQLRTQRELSNNTGISGSGLPGGMMGGGM